MIGALLLAAAVTTPPPAAPAQPIHWPARIERKLDNGLTIVMVPLHNVPKVDVELTFITGRGAESSTHPGVAQLAARVLTEGTPTRTSRQIKEELRSIGGVMSADVDNDSTTISASALSEFAKPFLDLLGDVAQHASYPQTEVDLAKTNFASDIEEDRSTPEFLADEQLEKSIFGKDPYGFVVPSAEAIAHVTREQLRTFAAAHYLPNNAHLIVAGDIDPDAAFSMLKSVFAGWKSGTLTPLTAPSQQKREKRQVEFVDRPGSVQSTILIGAPAPPRNSPDYIALRTANMIYGGAFYSRLTKNIREQKGYTYSPYSLADLRRRGGGFWASAEVRNEVTGPAILEMLYELDRMRVLPVTAEELDAAKTYEIGNLSLEIETQSGLASRIDSIYTLGLPHDFLDSFQAKVNALNAEDIQRVAQRYFDTYRSVIVVVGESAKVRDQVAPFGDVHLIDAKGAQH